MSGNDRDDRDPAQRPVIRDKRRIDPETGEVRQPPADTDDPLSPNWEAEASQHWAGAGEAYDDAADAGYAPQPSPYAEQAAAAYAEQGAAYAAQVDPAWSYEEAPQAGGAAVAPPEEAQAGEEAARRELAERTADLQRLQAEYANYRRRVERDRVAMNEQALANVLVSLLPLLDDVSRAREHGDLTGGFRAVGEALEATVEKLGLVRFGEAGEPFDPLVHEALTHTYSAEVGEPTAVAVLQPGYRIGDRVVRPARVAVAEPE